MRRAVLQVRIWNEIRSLADLPTDVLRSVLNRAFGLTPADWRDGKSGDTSASPTPKEGDGSHSAADSGEGGWQAPSAEPVTVDSKLRRWEDAVRGNGRGIMRYKGFRTEARPDARGALHGGVVSEGGQRIGMVTADTAAEFKRRMKRMVTEHLGKGGR